MGGDIPLSTSPYICELCGRVGTVTPTADDTGRERFMSLCPKSKRVGNWKVQAQIDLQVLDALIKQTARSSEHRAMR